MNHNVPYVGIFGNGEMCPIREIDVCARNGHTAAMTREQIWKNNLANYRKRAGLTQAMAADQIGTTVNYYGKIERGDRPLNHRWLMKLCVLLDASPTDLICEGYTLAEENSAGEVWIAKPETLADLLAVAMGVDEEDHEKRGELLDYANAVHTGLGWFAEDPANEDDPGFLKGVRKRVAEAIAATRSASSKAA